MPHKRADALATLRKAILPRLTGEFPHANRLIQRAGHKMAALRAESNRVDAILMALLALGPLDETRRLRVPNADALVQAAGCHVAATWRDGDGGHSVFYLERQHALVLRDVPQADGAVAGAGGDVPAIRRKVQRVDVLLVAREGGFDHFAGDVPDLTISYQYSYL